MLKDMALRSVVDIDIHKEQIAKKINEVVRLDSITKSRMPCLARSGGYALAHGKLEGAGLVAPRIPSKPKFQLYSSRLVQSTTGI